MTNDTISRAAAIAEFSCCELTPDGGIDANYAIDFLKQLPSVQQKPLKYSGDSLCNYCVTNDCAGCVYEPMQG